MNRLKISKQLVKIAKELVGQNEDNTRKEFEKLLNWAKRNFDKMEEINDNQFYFYKTYKKNNKIIGLKLDLRMRFYSGDQFFSCATSLYDNRENSSSFPWRCTFIESNLYSYDEGIKTIKNNLEKTVQQYIERLDLTKKPMNEKLQNNREYIETLREKNNDLLEKISDINSQQEEYKKLLNKF